MRRSVRAVALVVSALLGAVLPGFAAGTAELLADIRSGSASGSGFGIGELIPLGDRLLLLASEPSSGYELWVSDGTPLGTRLLLDLEPGSGSSDLVWLGTVGRAAVFQREPDLFEPYELWRSDGTVAGTFRLPSPPERCDFESQPRAVNAGGRLFFSPGGCGLWSSDGTVAGTGPIVDEEPVGDIDELVAAGNRVFLISGDELLGTNGDSIWRVQPLANADRQVPRHLTAAGSRVVLIAQRDEEEGEELWTSDGSTEGTQPLTGFFEAHPFGDDPFLRTIGTTVYFTADDGTGIDLWQSEGGAPARRVTDFVLRTPFGDFFNTPEIARAGNRLVFTAQEEGDFQKFLWVSEETPASTRRLTGCAGGCPAVSGASLVQAGSRILFAGPGGLWTTDGTGAGTRRLSGAAFNDPAVLPGGVFFIGPGGGGGFALWKTDGTSAGTIRLADLGRDPFGGSTEGFSPVATSGRIFFAADLDDLGRQLWVSDGSPAGTRVISGVDSAPGSEPAGFTPLAGGALFTAREGSAEPILWRTDGTTAGTVPIRAIPFPLTIVPVSGHLAFVLTKAGRFSDVFQVWRTDGTEAGSFRIDPAGSETLGNLAAFGRGVVFSVEDAAGVALWESNGTLAGTRVLADLPAGVTHVRSFKVAGSRLWFLASGPELSGQLWLSNGTAAGTRQVTEDAFDLLPVPAMEQVGGTTYFSTNGGLWKTDGTAAGTVEVLSTGFEEERPTDLVSFQGALYFMAGLPEILEHGLWRTDGTPEGTELIHSGGVPAERFPLTDPVHMVRLGDRLVSLSNDGVHGIELWASDGTVAGTVLVRDIAPGEASAFSTSEESSLVVANGKVYFSATDGTSGFELWESDGTAAGTRRVQDIAPAALSSKPDELAVAGDRLYFAADDGVHGREPWFLPLAGGGCVASATALCLGGRFRVEADWRDFSGNRGRGRAAALTADTGTFWFFDAANVEVILKVLDGRGINGHYWVFFGALSNVEYTLTVTDTQSGAVRRYFNPRGWLGSLADTEAFGPRGARLAGVVTEGPASTAAGEPLTRQRTATAGSCTPGAERLCLNGGRFAVEARWKTQSQTGTGKAVPLAGGDTGYFWFFDASNVEVVLKVLDGRPLNGKLWVFYGALSDVEYSLTVTDTETGVVKTYTNPRGRLASVADTGAF